jgi:hypothetical protein
VELFGKSYEGYLWANVSGLSLFGVAGLTNKGPPTPDELYDELRGIICHYWDLGILNKGRANSLLQKVDSSQQQWQKNGDSKAGTNILEALVKETMSMIKTAVLTQDQGDMIIGKALEVIDAIRPA